MKVSELKKELAKYGPDEVVLLRLWPEDEAPFARVGHVGAVMPGPVVKGKSRVIIEGER